MSRFKVYEEDEHGVKYQYQIIRKVKWLVFNNKEDFEKYFIEKDGAVPKLVENWRLGQEGDWVVADDGGVTQVIKRGPLAHPKDTKGYQYASGYIRTTVGTFVVTDSHKMDTDFEKHPNRYTFSGTTPFRIEDQIKARKNLSKNERIFAHNVAHGMDVVDAYNKVYYNNPNIKESIVKGRALLLMKQERIKKAVAEEVKDIAKSLGIDHEYILKEIKRVADQNMFDDPKTALEALKTLGKAIGTTTPDTNKLKGGVVGYIKSFSGALNEPEEAKVIEEKSDEKQED